MADRERYKDQAIAGVVDQVAAMVPSAHVMAGFRGSQGLSPTVNVMASAVVSLPFVVAAVVTGRWVLLLPAAGVMVLMVALLMKVVNSARVVGETTSELIVFSAKRGELTELGRFPTQLTVDPYWDKQWLKVALGGETIWVSRGAFGAVVERLAAPVG